MNFQSHSRRRHADALIEYKNIVNKQILYNVLGSMDKQGLVLTERIHTTYWRIQKNR